MVIRFMLALAVAAVGVGLGGGAAEAAPAVHEVSKTWSFTTVNGRPTIVPHVEDDTLDVKCPVGNKMRDFKVSDSSLVSSSGRSTDGRGVWVEPKFKDGKKLTVTAFCAPS
jgi:hypothetical protein